MFAQLVEGELDWAEFFFILAAIAFVVTVIVRALRPTLVTPAATLAAAGLACLALGFICW